MTEVPEGLSVYLYVGKEGSELKFEKRTTINANTPYLLHNSTDAELKLVATHNGGDFNIHGNPEPAGVEGFYGVNHLMATDGHQYGVQDATGELSLKQFNGVQMGNFRAYFYDPKGESGDAHIAIFEDNTTSISTVANLFDEGQIYTINGIEVSSKRLPKGVYIKNGKKIVVK